MSSIISRALFELFASCSETARTGKARSVCFQKNCTRDEGFEIASVENLAIEDRQTS